LQSDGDGDGDREAIAKRGDADVIAIGRRLRSNGEVSEVTARQ
jgi:hypothetical protein